MLSHEGNIWFVDYSRVFRSDEIVILCDEQEEPINYSFHHGNRYV
jgi:hypothetical protein